MASCVEQARSECLGQSSGSPADGKARAWQVEFDNRLALYVAENGLARLDRLNMVLLSTNSSEWLACIEKCPGTGVEKVCMPFVLELHFDLPVKEGCQQTWRDVVPWNNHPTKALLRDCPGEIAELTVVPELAPVQKAMITAKAISAGSALDVDGLVVKLTVAGTPAMRIDQVSESSCSVFDIPEGYQLVRGAKSFQRARAMQPELERHFEESKSQLRRELEEALRAARARIEPEVRKLCAENDFKVDDAEGLATCTFKLEAARALITKAVSEEMERVNVEAEPKLDAALRKHVIEPICRAFAPATPRVSK